MILWKLVLPGPISIWYIGSISIWCSSTNVCDKWLNNSISRIPIWLLFFIGKNLSTSNIRVWSSVAISRFFIFKMLHYFSRLKFLLFYSLVVIDCNFSKWYLYSYRKLEELRPILGARKHRAGMLYYKNRAGTLNHSKKNRKNYTNRHFRIKIHMKTRVGIHSIFHLLPFVRTLINIKSIGLVH